jgi:hypothetical protein
MIQGRAGFWKLCFFFLRGVSLPVATQEPEAESEEEEYKDAEDAQERDVELRLQRAARVAHDQEDKQQDQRHERQRRKDNPRPRSAFVAVVAPVGRVAVHLLLHRTAPMRPYACANAHAVVSIHARTSQELQT